MVTSVNRPRESITAIGPRWESDRVIVVLTPGNAGRAKDPYQDHACLRPDGPLGRLSRYGLCLSDRRTVLSSLAKCCATCVPSNDAILGKPDAGNPHVRFEEGEGAFLRTLLLYSTVF